MKPSRPDQSLTEGPALPPEGTPWVKDLAESAEGDRVSRCPQCAAAVAESAIWCSLCYADLRLPAPAPVALEASTDDEESARSEPRDKGGRHARGRADTPAAPVVPSGTTTALPPDISADLLDEELFALLREHHGPDPLNSWSARFAEPKVRWGMAAGGAAAIIVILIILATVFGSAF
jgi:hypothetical protein